MRRTLGLAVFSGMLGVTFFGLLLTPVFYFVIQSFDESRFCNTAVVRAISGVMRALLSIVFLGIPVLITSLRRKPGSTKTPPEVPPPDNPPAASPPMPPVES